MNELIRLPTVLKTHECVLRNCLSLIGPERLDNDGQQSQSKDLCDTKQSHLRPSNPSFRYQPVLRSFDDQYVTAATIATDKQRDRCNFGAGTTGVVFFREGH